MSNSFSIVEDKDGFSLKREGEDAQRFKSETEAIEAARKMLHGEKGEVSIFEPASGISRRVKLDSDSEQSFIAA